MKLRKSDILWKVIMEEVFDDLLRFIMPDADQEYNLERGFEFLEKNLRKYTRSRKRNRIPVLLTS
jgi:hypothetical protein